MGEGGIVLLIGAVVVWTSTRSLTAIGLMSWDHAEAIDPFLATAVALLSLLLALFATLALRESWTIASLAVLAATLLSAAAYPYGRTTGYRSERLRRLRDTNRATTSIIGRSIAGIIIPFLGLWRGMSSTPWDMAGCLGVTVITVICNMLLWPIANRRYEALPIRPPAHDTPIRYGSEPRPTWREDG